MGKGDAAHLYVGWQRPKRIHATEAERVRDLLGLVRALLALGKSSGAPPDLLVRLAIAERTVEAAWRSVRAAEPGSLAARDACARAAEATAQLERETVMTPAAPVVVAAAARIYQRGDAPPIEPLSADGERAEKKRPAR